MDLERKNSESSDQPASKKSKSTEEENKATKYTFTTEKGHSDFIRPWDREFTPDKPINLIHQKAVQQIELIDRLQLRFRLNPSTDDLVILIDKEIENMSRTLKGGHQVQNKEKKPSSKSSKKRKDHDKETCITALKLYQSRISHKDICKALNCKPKYTQTLG